MEVKENKYLKKVLKKMCSIVGVDYNKVNFTKENWFLEHSWTKEEEDKFKEWLSDYLYKDTKARENLTNIHTKNKELIKGFVSMFVLDYGWKTKDG